MDTIAIVQLIHCGGTSNSDRSSANTDNNSVILKNIECFKDF